jgi:hypothetical protein
MLEHRDLGVAGIGSFVVFDGERIGLLVLGILLLLLLLLLGTVWSCATIPHGLFFYLICLLLFFLSLFIEKKQKDGIFVWDRSSNRFERKKERRREEERQNPNLRIEPVPSWSRRKMGWDGMELD